MQRAIKIGNIDIYKGFLATVWLTGSFLAENIAEAMSIL
jgi:hypothetical protein